MTPPALLTVEYLPIGDLKHDPFNPRRISDEELETLTRSIQQFGLVDPIIVRRADLTVIGGHQRLVAARRLGYDAVPVVLVDLSQEQARLLNLALNKIAGTWDQELLARLLKDLSVMPEVDLSLSGFSEDELQKLLKSLEARDKRDKIEDFKPGGCPSRKSKPERDQHWDDYADPEASVTFYQTFLQFGAGPLRPQPPGLPVARPSPAGAGGAGLGRGGLIAAPAAHLGEGALGVDPLPLSLAARALLLRLGSGEATPQEAARRPEHGVAGRPAGPVHAHPSDPEARGALPASHPLSHRAGRRLLRALLGLGNPGDCGRAVEAALLRAGAGAALRGCGGGPLGGLLRGKGAEGSGTALTMCLRRVRYGAAPKGSTMTEVPNMAVEKREFSAGTVLVARYKKQAYRLTVVATEQGVRFRLEDGREFKSLSAAGSHLMGGKAVNGWRFWTLEGEAKLAGAGSPERRRSSHAALALRLSTRWRTRRTSPQNDAAGGAPPAVTASWSPQASRPWAAPRATRRTAPA